MYNQQKYFFYRCYYCGEWYYTQRVIKTKKCWKCNHSFLFKNAAKFTRNCTMQGAISLIKELKSNP